MPTGNRFVLHKMSDDYGARCWAIEDLALSRDNLVRHWRQRGKGAVTAHGIRPPKTGMIWRGTLPEAEQLCRDLNQAATLGALAVASDPPTRHNAREYAKERNARSRARTVSAAVRTQAALFEPCETCHRIHKKGPCP